MWDGVNKIRYFTVRIVDINDAPVPGRALRDWQVTFQRDGAPCADALSLQDLGGGNYLVSYTPSAQGEDVVEIYDAEHDLRYRDVEGGYGISNGGDDDGGGGDGGQGVYQLDHNLGGADALRITVTDPENYRVLVFQSLDWEQQKRAAANAIGSSSLDAAGRWKTPVYVVAGTYHVTVSKPQVVVVAFPYLAVGGN